jgi:hypothetical protein
MPHLEQYGVSVNIVFELDQLRGRTQRIEQLVNCVIAPEPVPEGKQPAEAGAIAGRTARLRALLAGTIRCWRARWPSAAPRPASTTSRATAPNTATCCAAPPAAAR